jgi:hypothetical protein
MERKIFYGEYTLRHWLDLILKRNILLPAYQRHFVWSKESVEKFLIQLKEGLFVPPVILGSFKKNVSNENIILDGQQRLTSVLLGYLGIYPKFDEFKEPVQPLFRDGEADDLDEGTEEIIAWTFNQILDADHIYLERADILRHVDIAKYDTLKAETVLEEWDLPKINLGFSYIVPSTNDEVAQQRFYSAVFRNINQQGVGLSGQESRKALYYLDSELVPLFEARCYESAKVIQDNAPKGYDFVRSLAFLSQYKHQNSETRIARKCYRQEQLEQQYEDYINAVVEDRESSRFGQFSTIIGKANIVPRLQVLTQYVEALGLGRQYASIIDADVYNFGLIYQVVIEGKTLKEDKFDELKGLLNAKIDAFKDNEAHKRSPGKVTYLRNRIKDSITIYSNYVIVPV